jgi:uncharacterized protein YggE
MTGMPAHLPAPTVTVWGEAVLHTEPADDWQPRRLARAAAVSHTVPIEAGEQAITASIEATFALVLG